VRRWLVALAALGGLAAVAAGALYGTLRWALAPADPSGEEVVFVVQRGQSVASVAAALEAQGLVRDARAAWRAGTGSRTGSRPGSSRSRRR
jgi:cell division protein YceG involved in septum cleavage